MLMAPVVNAQTADPLKTSRHLFAEVQQLQRLPLRTQRIQRAQQVFKQYVDFEDFVRLTLFDHWDTLTDFQKMQFKVAFANRLSQNVTDQVTDKPKRRFSATALYTQSEGQYTKVRCRIHCGKRNETVTLFWTSHNGWKVADIETSGVGLATNYQGQFNKIIRDHGFDELLRRIQSGTIK